MPKVQLQVKVEKDTLDKFRELMSVKYEGYAKRQLSMEVEQALRSWLATYKQSTLFPANGSGRPSVEIRKVEPVLAEKISVAAIKDKFDIDPEYIVESLTGMPVILGESLNSFWSRVETTRRPRRMATNRRLSCW